ncbi:hypothetical protein [Bacillus salipaludis]|uniref:Uncharacterized protein n=1 Tax=Bacillus salipaludis TaxID=2547811 RepID=A0AA90TX22_9BACI|nr:hypothetical protein [Bacillus salipaludis]MDQ6600869.1 hypothetical protein [Bacillus salipaludis]
MAGDTTHIAQIMFSKMMQVFGTDTSSFQQPSSVYKVGRDLYIRGSNEVPPKSKLVVKKPKVKHERVMEKKPKGKGKDKPKGQRKQKEHGNHKGHRKHKH